MASKVKPVPEGFHTVTPYLTLSNAAEAIEFYKKAFGAVELCRMAGPGGQGIGHAEIKIGDSHLFLADECPGMGNRSPKSLGGTTIGIHLNVEDVDAVFARAVKAGATPQMQPADMFWGDRFGKLADPFGHSWSVSTHIEDVTPEEMERRAVAAMAQMPRPQAAATAS
jgi:PhnB protein